MSAVVLPAPFDGQQIVLDAPYPLEPNTLLTVVVQSTQDDEERADWARLGQHNLAAAYGDNEPNTLRLTSRSGIRCIKGRVSEHSRRCSSFDAASQANGQLKIRPAVALRTMPSLGDILVCGISTQLHQRLPGFDEVIASFDIDFAASGLRFDSLIRLGFLTAQPLPDIAGVIGAVSAERHARLLRRLSGYLVEPLGPNPH